jgi:hypothetical protein
MMKEPGPAGIMKMISKVLVHPGVATAMMKWDRLFRRGEGIIGYGFIVGRKTGGSLTDGS